MKELIEKGWTRIRYKHRPEHWFIQVGELSNKTKNNIIYMADRMMRLRYVNKYDDI